MAYKCHKCDAPILVLRLGYCSNCREPISGDILTESKKQELAESEREYERQRELKRQQQDKQQQGRSIEIDRSDFGS
jgi:hypothetical protein